MYQLRDYQEEAVSKAVEFFQDANMSKNGVEVLCTGTGKSVVIAYIALRLDSDVLVFQPSREILQQNYSKLRSCGFNDCSIYSASCGSKEIAKVTFATIGSVKNRSELFQHFKYIIVDECHLVSAESGMYKKFFSEVKCKVLGLTATPFRLTSNRDFGSMLRFITRTRPRIFHDVIYYVQVKDMLESGYLSKIDYFDLKPSNWNDSNLKDNSTKADYTDESVRTEYKRVDFDGYLLSIVNRLLNPKRGGERKGILVFTRFIEEAQKLVNSIPGAALVTGETPKAERERIINDFRSGDIKVVANASVLTTGFDYPELDTIVMARPTKSLSLYYQIAGRGIRPHKDKESTWFVDLCGNIRRFGKVEDLELKDDGGGKWVVCSGKKQLTNVWL